MTTRATAIPGGGTPEARRALAVPSGISSVPASPTPSRAQQREQQKQEHEPGPHDDAADNRFQRRGRHVVAALRFLG